MNVIEREHTLREAARRYLLGEISYEALTRIRRGVDGLAARGRLIVDGGRLAESG